jgi:signal transduction histidine kinase
MAFSTVIPLNVAIGLLVFSVIGTLTGLWIGVVLLRRGELRRLSTVLSAPALIPNSDDKEYFGLPGTEDAARGLLRLAREQSGCPFALLFLPSHGDDCMTVTAFEGDGTPWQDAELVFFHPVIKRLASEGGPTEIAEGQGDVPLPAHTLLFPILSRGHLIGLVAVGPRDNRRPISRRSQHVIADAAAAAAVPLENAQLYASLRRAFSDLEGAQRALIALQQVSVAAQSSLRLDEVLEQIALGVVDGLPFDTAIVYLADAENHTLFMPVVARSGARGAPGQEPIPFDDGNPAMRALLSNEVLITHDVRESVLPRLSTAGTIDPVKILPNSTLVSLPLSSGGRVVGGMTLATLRPAISSSEIESLRSFAAQAAATIENARLYGRLEQAFSELRTAQDQLIRAERLRTLGQVASGVAHDFNNILAAIVTRAQLGQLQTRSTPLLSTLRVIEQAALDGASAARRIQSLGRPQDEQSSEILDLNAVAQQALDLTGPMWSREAQSRGVTIATVTSFAPEAFVRGLPGELREVLTNLILNAASAMPDGGTLTVRTERRGAEAWCTVEDTGTGMAEEVRSRVFDPFFTTKGEAGSGLGLSIVAAILQRHQGKIEIESKPGAGTSVRFALPAVTSRLLPEKPRSRRPTVSLRLLLAEEDATTRETLKLILTKRGHRVSLAAGAEEAMQLLVEQEFDIVITELNLGNHSGWEVAEATRLLRPGAGVILATARGADWDAGEVRRRGVDEVLSKPFTVDDVLASLERALLGGG